MSGRRILICDIDGTLSDDTDRLRLVGGEVTIENLDEYDAWRENDPPLPATLDLIRAFESTIRGGWTIYLTGRREEEDGDGITTRWLMRALGVDSPDGYGLFMRPPGCHLRADVLKMLLVEQALKTYSLDDSDVWALVDDDPRVRDLVGRAYGVPTLDPGALHEAPPRLFYPANEEIS